MRAARRIWIVLVALAAMPVEAQTVALSRAPDRVAVTIYRDPQRPAERAMRLDWLDGYALISEIRTVDVPAGEAEIRFEGVAGGILPQSAIVSGLAEGVAEKNQDAYLLSPASLVDRSLGRRVLLRRTSRATGAVREQEAVVRSGSGGALVLQTADGFEALRCSGLPETIVYERVPEGLAARPTLSVRTRSSRAARATIVLSYLATGFDWQANYVATLAPDGRRIDLFAWVTLANGDETSFANADTQAVAGQLNREPAAPVRPERSPLYLRCWPQQTTSDIRGDEEEIVVTGSRIGNAQRRSAPPPPAAMAAVDEEFMLAQQENLGDVKLYRIPEPVTVAARSQKQVAFLQRSRVRAEIVYRSRIAQAVTGTLPVQRVLVTRNRSAEGLGVPLPAGRLVLFGAGRERPILLGEGSLADRAVGEEVEVELGSSPGVHAGVVLLDRAKSEVIVTVSNPLPEPIRFEAVLPVREVVSATRLGRRNGMPLWTVTVPANGRATLRYRSSR